MCDLIDRQAAIDESFEIYMDGQIFEVVQVETLMGLPSARPDDEETNYWHEKANGYEQTLVRLSQIIAEQPEVIRCKGCENLQTDWKPLLPDRHYCGVMDSMMKEDDFCSYAERREDGQTN